VPLTILEAGDDGKVRLENETSSEAKWVKNFVSGPTKKGNFKPGPNKKFSFNQMLDAYQNMSELTLLCYSNIFFNL
jgi:hypothetical protein